MELRTLQYFLEVARTNSITKAANHLHVTQPTLSRQIKDLETELGKELFIRTNRNVILTQEGILLKKRVEEILALIRKTESEISSEKELKGDVYIGSAETVAITPIIEVIKEIRENYPEIKFHFHSGNAEDVMDRINKGIIDFGILIQPADVSNFESLKLPSKVVWGILMRDDSSFAKKKYINNSDLVGKPLIISEQIQESKENPIKNWFGKYYSDLKIASTYNLIFNSILMVESGIGYALTLKNLINTEKKNLSFKRLEPKIESEINFIWKKDQVFSKPSELFLQRIIEKFN